MTGKLVYCATDNEIFDVLVSSKRSISEAVMLEIARDRGIFYSPKDTREYLAEQLSLLPHDYHDLQFMLEQREHVGRADKITSVTLTAPLTIEDIKEISKEYQKQSPESENVKINSAGTDRYDVAVHYSEIDHSKTRLIQRKPKVADIEFIVEGDRTTVRMPATVKAKQVFGDLKNLLDGRLKQNLPTQMIELTEFVSADAKTNFFTYLISELPDFKLFNVNNVNVEPVSKVDEGSFDLENDEETEEAKQEALALVKKVALSGESLLGTEEYQTFRKKGFFITSITWRAKQQSFPYPVVAFSAGFEEPHGGTGFKYSVHGMLNFIEGEYTKTLRPIPEEDKQKLLSLIEKTATNVIAKLRAESATAIKAAGGSA